MWDLRNTYSPSRYLEGHTKGIWALSWCPMDYDLLLSCAKDNRTLCWNVKTGEMLRELEHNPQSWNFDVQWSPRIPTILSTCSLEGKIKIFSMQDVTAQPDESTPLASKIKAHAPKWLKRPVGATFGFGGRLVSFTSKAGAPKSVVISQVEVSKEFLKRVDDLQEAITKKDFKNYCQNKINSTEKEDEKHVWEMIKTMFEEKQRSEILSSLGFDMKVINEHLEKFSLKKDDEEEKEQETNQEPSNESENINKETETLTGEEPEKTQATKGFFHFNSSNFIESTKKGPIEPIHFNFEDSGRMTIFPIIKIFRS